MSPGRKKIEHTPANDALANTAERRLHLGGIGNSFAAIDSTGSFYPTASAGASEARLRGGSGAFGAIRIKGPSGTYTARLHCGENEDRDTRVPALERNQLAYREDFPTAHFAIRDEACPIPVVYSVFSPIIPFDQECSVLPVLLYCLRFVNETDAPLEISALLSWTPPVWRDDLAPQPEPASVPVEDHGKYRLKEAEAEPRDDAANVVAFGAVSDDPEMPENGGILGVFPDHGLELSRSAWDPADESSAADFWGSFSAHGVLPGRFHLSEKPTHGAVCAAFTLPPGEVYRLDFALVWCGTATSDLRPSYSRQYRGAYPLAQQALRYVEYYYHSIEDWQKRLAQASLPAGMGRAMVHALNVMTSDAVTSDEDGWALPTATIYTAGQRAILRLYASFANAVLFPRFEESEWDLFARLIPESNVWRHEQLAALLALKADDVDLPLILATQVITLYRNHRLTGGQVRMRKYLPALSRQLALHEPFTGRGAFESGLWIAAQRACAELLKQEKKDGEAAKFTDAYQRGIRRFDEVYWDAETCVYREAGDTAERPGKENYCGQLVLQFLGDFLGWGHVLATERIQSSVAAYGDPALAGAQDCGAGSLRDLGNAGQTLASIELTALSFVHAARARGTRQLAALVARAVSRHTAPAPEWLALWHLLYTVQGVFLDVAAGTLRIAPHLPEGVDAISAPLFTSVCLGKFQYFEELQPLLRIRIRVTLDSPVKLHRVEILVPGTGASLGTLCALNEEKVKTTREVRPHAGGAMLTLQFSAPLVLKATLDIEVVETA